MLTEYEKLIDESVRYAVAELASGAVIRYDEDGSPLLVRDLKQPEGPAMTELFNRGWLASMANGGTFKLSDEGLQAYLRSTDELQDGVLRAPDGKPDSYFRRSTGG